MGTIEMRGVLAVVLIASSGLLTGMAALPAGEPAPAGLEVATGRPGEGLFKRVMHRACLVSVAATRSDLRSAADRERECR
ncbi:hypothetical protein [Arenimonas sp.]|uniref:hypothetical protein n=1 Tax=Arenimonas sp. TaxID=1872635 RepID=UPI002E35C294|nr:hypothetical protein [Arenimonas sp.]HEX4853011.1 hypothetical protein [Arenimonas sp.]